MSPQPCERRQHGGLIIHVKAKQLKVTGKARSKGRPLAKLKGSNADMR